MKVVIRPGLDEAIAQVFGGVAAAAAAEEVARIAKDIAPFDPEHSADEPHYRDQIYAEGTLVIAGASYSVYLEFGTSDTPTFATLRKAAAQAGLRRVKT